MPEWMQPLLDYGALGLFVGFLIWLTKQQMQDRKTLIEMYEGKISSIVKNHNSDRNGWFESLQKLIDSYNKATTDNTIAKIQMQETLKDLKNIMTQCQKV